MIKESDKRDNAGSIYWTCKCECGNIKDVSGNSLRKGKSTNCGCRNKQRLADLHLESLVGRWYSDLVVLEKTDKRESGSVVWKCKCKCGNICYRNTNILKRLSYHGCNECVNRHNGLSNKNNLIGQKFGKLLVLEETLERTNSGNVIWKCKCDCGNICKVSSSCLIQGNTSSCGCINYSIGERNIEDILKENNIQFITQYTEKSLQKKKFDFAIIKNNQILQLIEFDGQQHYSDISGIWNSPESLQDIQKRDEEKNQWAKEHNIPLVRIPYWKRDNITLDMILGDEYLVKE